MPVRRLPSLSRFAFVAATAIVAACTTQPRQVAEPVDARTHDAAAACALAELAAHDVAWTAPGGDEAGSMPIGNGTFGANVWFDAKGDLLVLLSHTDAFSEI